MTRAFLAGAGVLFGLLLSGPQAEAQVNPAEIRKKIKETLPKIIEASPTEKLEFGDAVVITYKKVITDPQKIAKLLGRAIAGNRKIPQAMIDQALGMYKKEISEAFNDALRDAGEIHVKKVIKARKKIPVGKFRIGFQFKGDKPVAMVIFDKTKKKKDKKLKKPIVIRLATKLKKGIHKEFKLKLKKDKKKKKKNQFHVYVDFLRYSSRTSRSIEIK